jgi:hypothetical protein
MEAGGAMKTEEPGAEVPPEDGRFPDSKKVAIPT